MDPAFMLNNLDPANNFAMGGIPMAMTRLLLFEGKPLPKTLFFRHISGENTNTNTTYKKPSSKIGFNSKYQ